MIRGFKYSLMFAAVTISSCQAADKRGQMKAGLREFFKPSHVQCVTSSGYKQNKKFTATLVNGTVASAHRLSRSDGPIYAGCMLDPSTNLVNNNTAAFFYELGRAFQRQETDPSKNGIRSTDFTRSLIPLSAFFGAAIKRWTRECYTVRYENNGSNTYIHTTEGSSMSKESKEKFTVDPHFSPACKISEELFKCASKQKDERYYEEGYEATLLTGIKVLARLTQNKHKTLFKAVCTQPGQVGDDEATFLVVQQAYQEEKARKTSFK
jgi:hypothetical protein